MKNHSVINIALKKIFVKKGAIVLYSAHIFREFHLRWNINSLTVPMESQTLYMPDRPIKMAFTIMSGPVHLHMLKATGPMCCVHTLCMPKI